MGALTALSKSNINLATPGKAAPMSNERKGHPDEMPLNKIHPDPHNLRRKEDENTTNGIDEQQELTADIKKRGVKSPISLRPHPEIKEEYMINFGHRRYKGAVDAGLATIPYFLDVSFDSYDQVKENLLHRDPSIWALAEFVQHKLEVEKQSKGQVAEGLGKNLNVVTELLTLVNAPSCLHRAYSNGVKSPRTLYDLRRAYDEFSEQVDAWCDSGANITRDTIQDLLKGLRHDVIAMPASAIPGAENDIAGPAAHSPGLRHDVKTGAIDDSEQPRDERQIGLVDTLAAGEQAAATNVAAAIELRHDVKNAPLASQSPAAPELRHDVKMALKSSTPKAPLASPKASAPHKEIVVQYNGKAAKIAPDTIVQIVMDGLDAPLEVQLSELVFKVAT